MRIDKDAEDGKEDEEMINSQHPAGSIDHEMLMLRKMTRQLRIEKDAKEDKGDEEQMINSKLLADLLVDILARVDITSLSKLQCVCKLWKELISDSYSQIAWAKICSLY